MDKNKILEIARQAIAAFDLNDEFGDDIDARHQAEEDAVHALHALINELEKEKQETTKDQ